MLGSPDFREGQQYGFMLAYDGMAEPDDNNTYAKV